MEPGADPNAEASFVNPKAKIPVFVVNWSGGGGAASGAGAVARRDGGCERRAGGCEAAAARGDDSDPDGRGSGPAPGPPLRTLRLRGPMDSDHSVGSDVSRRTRGLGATRSPATRPL